MDSRVCGACSACCTVATVPELEKPGGVACPHQRTDALGGCTIHGSEQRPTICSTFQCQWLRGFGAEEDRPDLAGALVTINETTPGRVIGFLKELEPNAVTTTGRDLAVRFALTYPLPLIVVDFEADDSGSRVVLHQGLREKAERMLGPCLERLTSEVSLYQLKKGDG